MANSWLRLWHDMPTDPKFKTIARKSGEPIAIVISIYIHLLVDASKTPKKGRITISSDDLASALDIEIGQVEKILNTMNGRVLDGDIVIWFGRFIPSMKDLGVEPNRPPSHIWKAIRERIFKRDNYTCKYCGDRGVKLECDHITPVALGGHHDDDNLATACFSCNRSKRAKLVSEWEGS